MLEKFSFNPESGLRNQQVFPSDPDGEDAAREQFMTLFDQLKNYVNYLADCIDNGGDINGGR